MAHWKQHRRKAIERKRAGISSGKKRAARQRSYTKAGPVTITYTDGTTRTEPAYSLDELARYRAGASKARRGISKATRSKILKRDSWRCRYCYCKVGPDAARYEIDHVRPVAEGGRTIIENLVTACRSCNQQKGVENWVPRSNYH